MGNFVPKSVFWHLKLECMLLLVGIICQLASVSVFGSQENGYQIEISTGRPEAIYKCGEEAVFEISVKKLGILSAEGVVTVTLTNDGEKVLSTSQVDLSQGNPFKIKGTLDHPGFLRCEATLKDGTNTYSSWGGAGFNPQEIKPALPTPEDFKTFWAKGIAELDKIPLDVKLTRLDKFCTDKFDCYKVSFANIDNTRIFGYLSVPKGKGPFPALVTVPGAGPGHNSPDTLWAAKGVLVLRMNVHKYDPPADPAELNKVYAQLNMESTYSLHGAPDREKYYFRRAFLGISRAVNWLCSRNDWDGRHLVAVGSSQGGGTSLVLAGLNDKITAVAANVPAMCDHGGFLLDRKPGWPGLARAGEPRDKYLEMSAYFDVVNFAKSIKCPTIVCVGFIDRTCSPSSVYAAFNSIDAPKLIINKPLMGHDIDRDFTIFQDRWIAGQLGLKSPIKPLGD